MFNIHKLAGKIIRTAVPAETVSFRHNSTKVSESGIVEIEHGEWESFVADVEPGIVSSFGSKNISEKEYSEMGLDWSHEFFTLWVSDCDYKTIAGASTSDQVKVRGVICNIRQIANWGNNNGWRRMYCERVIEE